MSFTDNIIRSGSTNKIADCKTDTYKSLVNFDDLEIYTNKNFFGNYTLRLYALFDSGDILYRILIL
jgi:hypothetical protein